MVATLEFLQMPPDITCVTLCTLTIHRGDEIHASSTFGNDLINL